MLRVPCSARAILEELLATEPPPAQLSHIRGFTQHNWGKSAVGVVSPRIWDEPGMTLWPPSTGQSNQKTQMDFPGVLPTVSLVPEFVTGFRRLSPCSGKLLVCVGLE